MRKYFKRISVAAVACAVAVTSLTPTMVFAQENQNADSSLNSDWSKDIDSMLEGRDYVEGSVLAVFDNSVSEGSALSTLSDDEESEELAVLSDDAVSETIDADVKDSDEAASVRVITSDEKTTEELLNELASNPAVIYAEPDYISSTEDLDETELNTETETTLVASESVKTESNIDTLSESTASKMKTGSESVDLIGPEGQNYEKIGDLTKLQWGYTDEDTSLYSIHSPNWNKTEETNIETDGKKPVVAVIDSGIDYNHPEFDGVIVNLNTYVDFAGDYGYNCTGKGDPTDPMDDNGHGTHCAGIIAAKWDGTGTSGVASGAELAIIRASVGGSFYDSKTVRGFMCLIEAVKKGMNLKSINCSFGGDSVGNVLAMMVNEIGELGVVTCFASGNSAYDNDDCPETSSEIFKSPYSLVVDAADTSGELADFSDYGQTTTDLVSPGNAILAPVSKEDACYMASVDENRKTYDGFTNSEDESGVKISYLGTYDINETESLVFSNKEEFENIIDGASETGERISDENSFDNDESSYEVDVKGLSSTDLREVYLVAVPIDENDISDITGLSVALKSTLKGVNVWAKPFTILSAGEDDFNGSVNIAGDDGWRRASNVWSNMPIGLTEAYLPYYKGCIYFIAEVKDLNATGEKSKLYIDSVGAGNSVLRYAYLEGTSMATPAITGSVAVLYNELEKEGKLDGLTADERAAYVADSMKAKTEPKDALKSKCTSNGAFDFNVSEENYTPVMENAYDSDDGVIIINGNFLGEETGKVSVDGIECKIESWNNVSVVAEIPSGLENGRYSLDLTKTNGKTSTRKIVIDDVKASETEVFEGKVELPEELAGCRLKITALDGVLYAFPETLTGNYGNTVIYDTMWAYDKSTGEWTKCEDIPVSETAKTGIDNNSYDISVNAYQDFVVAEINYAVDTSAEVTKYANEIFLYYPETETWTKLDISKFTALPASGTVCGCDAGLFYFGGDKSTGGQSEKIYKLEFDSEQVKNKAESVEVTKITEAGTFDSVSFGFCQVSSYGDEILYSRCLWLKWSKEEQKFVEKKQMITDLIGAQHDSVGFIAQFAATLTPSGAIVAALNGNDYLNRGYDTFYFSEDGTRTPFEKLASYGDLYNPSACYSDGTMYVWGDSYYGEGKTEGVLVYTSVNMPKIESISNVSGGVKLTWRSLDYDANVRVFYKTENGSWKVAGDTTGNSFTVKGLTSGTKYTFTLRAVDETGVSYLSSYDKVGTSLIYLDKTTAKAANVSTGIKLSWNKVEGAAGYKVYRKDAAGSYELIKTIKKNSTVSFTDKTAKNGTAYTYYVEAYNGKSVSAHNTKTLVRLTRPQIKALKNTGKSKATLKWSKNSKATGYQILYKCGSKSKKITVKSYKTVKKVIKKLKKNKTYRFYVRSYKKVSGKTYYSSWSKAKKVKIKK